MYTAPKDESVSTIKNGMRAAVNDVAEVAKEDLRDTAAKAGRKVRNFIHLASDDFSHAKETVTSQIRTKPLQSGLIALGVGFLLGALARR